MTGPTGRGAGAVVAGLASVNARIDWIVVRVTMAAVAVMFAVVVAQVFFRYVLNASLTWAEEAARYLLVLTTFLGTSIAMRRGAHIRVGLVVERLPRPARVPVELLVEATGGLVYLVLIRHGLVLARANFDQASPAMGLSLGWVYLMIPLAGVLLTLQAAERVVAQLRGAWGPARAGPASDG